MALEYNKEGVARSALTNLVTLVSFAAIAMAMMMTVGDILIRFAASAMKMYSGTRPQWGLFGLVDLTQLAIMWAAPLAIAAAFFRNSHINVDILTENMSPNWRRASAVFAALAGMALIGVCIWTATREMLGQLDFTTTSATLGITYTWYWTPLILGFAFCFLALAMNFYNALQHREMNDV